ncbi:MAG: hypothetical protein NT141_04205 [candidate division WWE3 bacterium]|nr:hypothetical protein [candidate division WWE3 bacterium]
MPRFIYTIITINLLFLISLVLIFFKIPPTTVPNKIIFLVDLLITISLAFSVVIYKLVTLNKSIFSEPRYIYRNALRRGILLSLFLTLSLGFKFWNVATKLNIILVILFLVAVEFYFWHRSRIN